MSLATLPPVRKGFRASEEKLENYWFRPPPEHKRRLAEKNPNPMFVANFPSCRLVLAHFLGGRKQHFFRKPLSSRRTGSQILARTPPHKHPPALVCPTPPPLLRTPTPQPRLQPQSSPFWFADGQFIIIETMTGSAGRDTNAIAFIVLAALL